MSRCPWNRDRTTGVPIDRLPDDVLLNDDSFNVSLYPDCNVFDVRTAAYLAGSYRVDNFKRLIKNDPSSSFHFHQVIGEFGKTVAYLTHSDSAMAGGEKYRLESHKRMYAGKKWTDVSG